MCACLRFFVVQLVCCSSVLAETPLNDNDVLVAHNSCLLMRTMDRQEVHVISIVADQILYSSRAYVHVWKFRDIDEMIKYLKLQDSNGPTIPAEVSVARCEAFTLNSVKSPRVGFVAHGRSYEWYPGNINSSWLHIDKSDDVELLGLADRQTPIVKKFMPWKDFAKARNRKVYDASWMISPERMFDRED
jgi:hypothetical protein